MNTLTISALTTHIVNLFAADEVLRDVWITGEVSNWTKARSGHIYFSLKDSGANISAVMWKGNVFRHSWLPTEGDQILAHGYVDVYPERGIYQFYADEIRPAGRGQLYAQFEALKQKLMAEGLFNGERKRPIPAVPQRIGVVTSDGAAALRDVLRVLSQRWPLVEVILFHTLVQGNEAPAGIVSALAAANRYGQGSSLFDAADPLDVILLVRGGGSIEDLWAFNDERVARAVAESALPVISGVGHETDFTIVDFASDLRMPTPSAAAAAAVPDRVEALAQIAYGREALAEIIEDQIAARQYQLEECQARLRRSSPQRALDRARQSLDELGARLHRHMDRQLQQRRERLESAELRLNSLNPAGVLARGYSLVQRIDGSIVTDPQQVAVGEALTVHAAKGVYRVRRSEDDKVKRSA
ncbi:MAG: exodeoxyribonuclease VII large subunit [Caldilineaceae bacterium]|nr:exodeoxyribonuclease VII large subunit [Caldilineaceae bacterium]